MLRAWACSPSASASATAAGPTRAERRRVGGDPGGALEEIEHRQPGGEARGAAGRQHVVRAGDVVAHRLRAEAAEEHRAGMADAGEQLGRIARS